MKKHHYDRGRETVMPASFCSRLSACVPHQQGQQNPLVAILIVHVVLLKVML